MSVIESTKYQIALNEFKIVVKKKRKKFIMYFYAFILLILAAFIMRIYLKHQYNTAEDLMRNGRYQEAIDIFKKLGPYQSSVKNITIAEQGILYDESMRFYDDGKYELALEGFTSLNDFKESNEMVLASKYEYAVQLFNESDYDKAAQLFRELGDYKNSKIYLAMSILPSIDNYQNDVYSSAIMHYSNKNYIDALKEFECLQNYEDCLEKAEECRVLIYEAAMQHYNELNFIEALKEFECLQDYKDSLEMAEKCREAINIRKLATTISAGIRYTIGLQDDGTILSTGYNENGQSDFSQWNDIISVASQGIISVGLKADGTVVTAGKLNGRNIDTSDWENIVQIVAGERYVVGLKMDGTLVGAGHDQGDGQLQFSEWNNIVTIAAGWRHTVGLDAEGNIHITGYGSQRQLKQIEDNKDAWNDIVAIAAGGGNEKGKGHTVGLRSDGTVVAVGDNEYGQCNVEDWTNIIAIAAGDWHTVGLKSDGTVVATGWDGTQNFYNIENACTVEDWKDIKAIAAGAGYTVGLHSDGTLVSVGYNDNNKRDGVKEWKNIKIYDEWNERHIDSN